MLDFIDSVLGLVLRLDELVEAVSELCLEGGIPLYEEGGGARWPPSTREELLLEWLQEFIGYLTA